MARRPAGRLRDQLLVLLFMLGITVPGLALVAGMRPENLENRAFATFPPLSVGALGRPELYAGIDSFLKDAFPFRTMAVNLKARLEYGLLRSTTSSNHVVAGLDDWLFFDQEVFPTCPFSATEVLGVMDAAAARLAGHGISLRFMVVPDKLTVYPEHIGEAFRRRNCTGAQRQAMRDGMAARPGTTSDLWGPILTEKAIRPEEPLYWRQDTHWTPQGALPAIRQLIETQAPGVWDPGVVILDGTFDRQGDLSRFLGLPRSETTPRLVVRDANTLESHEIAAASGAATATVEYTVTGPDAVIPGRTLIIHDSMFATHADLIAPWFADSVWLDVLQLRNPQVIAALPPFDAVIIERVERVAYLEDWATSLRPLLDRLDGGAAVDVAGREARAILGPMHVRVAGAPSALGGPAVAPTPAAAQ